jgi:uncharacterized protein
LKTVNPRAIWPALLSRGAIVTAAIVVATSAHTSEPAFDCAEAEGQVQQLVCSDNELAALDRQLAIAYQAAQETLPPDELPLAKARQRGWIKGRDDCWKADDVSQCVVTAYQTRIVELQIATGQFSPSATVSLDCDSSIHMPFFAAFYNDTSPPSVVLTRGTEQTIAFIARSGSGSRYTRTGVEYWEHQGQASINWFGTKLVCQVGK